MYAVVLTILPSLSFLYTATVFAFIGVFCMIYSELFISLMFREIRPWRFLIANNILARIKKVDIYSTGCTVQLFYNEEVDLFCFVRHLGLPFQICESRKV